MTNEVYDEVRDNRPCCEQKRRFQAHLQANLLSSFHSSQKWLWAVAVSVSIFYLMKGIADTQPSCLLMVACDSSAFGKTFLYALVVAALLVRFYGGDSRILDFLYHDIPKALQGALDTTRLLDHSKRLTKRTGFVDGFLRVVQYALLAVLASLITYPSVFPWFLGIILLFNAFLCLAINRVSRPGLSRLLRDYLGERAWTHMKDLADARRQWAYVNSITAVLIISWCASLMPYVGPSSWWIIWPIFGALAATTLWDLVEHRDIYVPDFGFFSVPSDSRSERNQEQDQEGCPDRKSSLFSRIREYLKQLRVSLFHHALRVMAATLVVLGASLMFVIAVSGVTWMPDSVPVYWRESAGLIAGLVLSFLGACVLFRRNENKSSNDKSPLPRRHRWIASFVWLALAAAAFLQWVQFETGLHIYGLVTACLFVFFAIRELGRLQRSHSLG